MNLASFIGSYTKQRGGKQEEEAGPMYECTEGAVREMGYLMEIIYTNAATNDASAPDDKLSRCH